MEFETFIPYLQIIVAMILGALLGAERTFAGKTAGMRTFGLVAMGSCLLTLSSSIVDSRFIGVTDFDPMRLSAGVITGIGFIGAGLIILRENKLEGLTTAAGLWVACGIGITIGFGLWALALFATFITLFTFTILWYIEEHLKKKFKRADAEKLGNNGL